MNYKLYDDVVLLEPLSFSDVAPGSIGTIVYVHDRTQAYTVEFVGPDNRSSELVTVEEHQIAPTVDNVTVAFGVSQDVSVEYRVESFGLHSNHCLSGSVKQAS